MKVICNLNSLFLCTLMMVSCRSSARSVNERADSHPQKIVSKALQDKRLEAFRLVQQKRYQEAIPIYLEASRMAKLEKNDELAIQFLNNIAGCYHLSYRYRDAIQFYKKALEQSTLLGIKPQESLALINTASLYVDCGDYKAAAEILKRKPINEFNFVPATRLDSFLQLGNILTRLKDPAGARQAFEKAILEAERDAPAEYAKIHEDKLAKWSESLRELRRAWAFTTIAQALTLDERFQEAEIYSLEAFRIRSTFRDKARFRDALQLAILMRHQKHWDQAQALLQAARQIDPDNNTPMHLFLIEREQATVAFSKADFPTSLHSLKSALNRARSWRMEVLPSNAAFLSFEEYLTGELQSQFLKTIILDDTLAISPDLAAEAFWAAEEARFASMRATQLPAEALTKRLSPAYWETLSTLHQLQSSAPADSASRNAELTRLKLRLNELEVEAGLTIPHAQTSSAIAFSEWQARIPKGEAVFSYYLAEPNSLAWKITSNQVSMRRIASKPKLAQLVEDFRSELMASSQNGKSSTGMELSKQLFGENSEDKGTTPFWTMVLDQELSRLPIAALPSNARGTSSTYLVEDRILRTVPTAILLGSNSSSSWSMRAVGLGDPIYNNADPRAKALSSSAQSLLQLNRLPSSERELHRGLNAFSAQHWKTDIFTGTSATAMQLRTALSEAPDVIHISSHFLPESSSAPIASIALSPEPRSGSNSHFSAFDLNSIRTATKLVVLSGCSSNAGQAVEGVAIDGLSRAFLIAGASTVVATLWPTLDSDGPIFPDFYRSLGDRPYSQRSAAQALRLAQINMIRGGGWTSRPSYWAAYVAISKG
jgi:CHAT domain-containing protein